MQTFVELEKAVINWAKARHIIPNATPNSQLLKAVSEVGELADAANKLDQAGIKDAVGDIVVCLINYCALQGTSLVECLEIAYNDIKDRRGIMLQTGVFQKEDPVSSTPEPSDAECLRLLQVIDSELGLKLDAPLQQALSEALQAAEPVETPSPLHRHLEMHYPEHNIVTPDGFDEAFIGVARQAGGLLVAVYDRDKCIEILARDMSLEDAEEYFAFNTEDAYVGSNTPMFLQRPTTS